MQKFKRLTKKYLVIIIFLLALILRVWKIAEFPAGLNADEAAIGYNAYSLLQTGKDEFGHPWPINFQSFNDFKPGLYFYLVLPFVKIFGLNVLAVRLPSAILGSLTVLVLYFLIKEMGFTQIPSTSLRVNSRRIHADTVALIAVLLLTISPWHLHFSRGGWESNVATFFITLGVYFFFKALKNPKNFTLCALSFALSAYTYHSARVIAPLLFLGLLVFFLREIFQKRNWRWLAITLLTGIILVSPLLFSFFGPEVASRFSGVGIFADQGPYWRTNELRGQDQNPFSGFSKIIHNKYLEYGFRFFDNYLRHFNGDFFFISGDEIQRNKVPEMGQMYLIEIPFLVLGLYFLVRNKPKNWQFILWWLAVAPVASAMTFQSPHAIRSLNMVIPLIIITSYGIMSFAGYLKEKTTIKTLFTFYFLLFTFYFWCTADYLHQYYVHYPKIYPAAWEYGFRELIEYVKDNEGKYEKIYVTDKYDQPYILFAFFLKYSPENFQKEAKLTPKDQFGFSTVANFGKYYFGSVDLNKIGKGNVMIIGSPGEIPDSQTMLKRIYFKDNKTEAFRVIEQ